jgi:hypothetical protein
MSGNDDPDSASKGDKGIVSQRLGFRFSERRLRCICLQNVDVLEIFAKIPLEAQERYSKSTARRWFL